MKLEIPLLNAEDVSCRVQSVTATRNGSIVGATLVIHKNARVDMKMLDLLFGVTGWQRSHEIIEGNLYCNVDIWDDERKQWVRKQDVGTESTMEKEKGEASDAFKRAATNIGIGRELYTAPNIWVTLGDKEYRQDGERNGKPVYKCNSALKFIVSEIGYNERREINRLLIVDNRGDVRFDFRAKTDEPRKKPRGDHSFVGDEYPAEKLFCDKCRRQITAIKDGEGRTVSPQRIASKSNQVFGLTLCAECAQKQQAEDAKDAALARLEDAFAESV